MSIWAFLLAYRKGRIYQRPFGGQSKDFGGGGQAARTCAAADRTGHALLHPLPTKRQSQHRVFKRWFAVDLVKNQDGAVVGVIAINMEDGETVYIRSKATVLATGGAGRIYASTTNAHINTGDGVGNGPARRLPGARHRNGNFTPPALQVLGCWQPRAAGVKVVFWSIKMASALWALR